MTEEDGDAFRLSSNAQEVNDDSEGSRTMATGFIALAYQMSVQVRELVSRD